MIIIDENEITIENYQKIRSIDDHKMIVEMKHCEIVLKGNDIKVRTLNYEECRILMKLKEVFFYDL